MIVDPETVDWTGEDDSSVWWAAQSGIPEAQDEARRRGLDKPATQSTDLT